MEQLLRTSDSSEVEPDVEGIFDEEEDEKRVQLSVDLFQIRLF